MSTSWAPSRSIARSTSSASSPATCRRQRTSRKLANELEADALVQGKLSNKKGDNRIAHFKLFVHGKKKGFSVEFSNLKSDKLKQTLHDKMLEKIGGSDTAGDDGDKKSAKTKKSGDDEEADTKSKKKKGDDDEEADAESKKKKGDDDEEADAKSKKKKKGSVDDDDGGDPLAGQEGRPQEEEGRQRRRHKQRLKKKSDKGDDVTDKADKTDKSDKSGQGR